MKFIKIFILPVFLIVACGLLLHSAYVEVKNRTIDQLNNQQLVMAETAARGIKSFFEHYDWLLTQVSKMTQIASFGEQGKQLMQVLYMTHADEIKGITRVDASGRIIYTFPETPSAIGMDLSSQEHIQKIVKTHQPVVSDVFDSVQGFMSIAFHVPVFEDESFQGSLGILIPFDKLSRNHLEPIKIGKDGYAWIITRKGIELYCPVPGHMGKSVFENCKDFPSILSMAREMVKGNSGTTAYFFDQLRGETVETLKKQAAYVPVHVGDTFWSIVVATPEAEVVDVIQGFRDRWFLVIGLLMLIAITWTFYTLRAFKILKEEEKRKQAEKALKASEEKYRELVETANSIILRMDDSGKVTFFNEFAQRFFGYSEEEMIGKNVVGTIVPEIESTGRDLREMIRDIAANPGDYAININENVRRNGERVWVAWTNKPILGDNGHVKEILCIGNDITERKHAEEALRESEEKYRSLFEHSLDAILLTAPDGSILDANQAACGMFGRSLDEIKNVGRSGLVDMTDPRLNTALSERTRTGLAIAEISLLRANGDKFPAEVTSTVFVDASGQQKTSMIIRDISERKMSEKALRERDIRFKKLSLHVPGMIYQFMRRPDGTYCCPFTTEAISDIFGCSPQDVRDDFSPITRVILPEDLEKLMDSIESSAERMTTWQCEYRVQIPGQPIRWMFGQSTPEKLGDGSIIWHGFNTDITERKQAEAALQASEQEKTTLNEIANVFLTIPDDRIYEEVLNVVLKRMQSGYGVFGFISKTGDLVIPSMTREVWTSCQVPEKSVVFPGHTWGNSLWGRAIREQRPFRSDGPFHTPEGHILIDNFLTVPVIYASKTIGLLSVANKEGGFTEEDKIQMGRIANAISPILNAQLERDRLRREREKAEKALRDSSVRFEAQYQGIPVPTFTWQQKEGDFVLVNYNRAAIALTDGKVAEYVGKPASEMYQDRPDILRDLHLCATHKQIVHKETVSGGVGSGRDVVMTFVFVPSDLVMIHMEDITERKQAEQDRKTLQDRLHRAEKMEALGTLAGGVAHDLNNVLGIVVGYSELLLDALHESSSARSKAMEILKGGQRAAAIVQDLLTLARRGVQGRTVVNLNNIVMECLKSPEFSNILSYHPNIQIKTDLEPDLLNLSGSSVHLRKSFINLVSNAAEAMPNGGILTVRTANRYLDKPISGYDEVREGDYVVLSLSDTGEGIPACDLKRIFEPFYTKKVMGRSGTGLGLAVVWGTVKDHLGYINVESEEGKGTIFTLYFPVTREELTPEQVSVAVAEYMGKGETILVIDDVKEQRDLATAMLTKLNYVATSVSSGEEALQYLEKQTVDLIVLDMIMDPGMDGLDTYARILERYPHQKAIIVSGFSQTERVSKAQALGAGAYVKKPYVLEKLGLAVRKGLDRVT